MPGPCAPSATREQVLAFRLSGHHLDERLPRAALLQAAGACGLQNTGLDSALIALGARLLDLTPSDFNQALESEKSLLQTWSLRTAAHVFPSADAPVFTRAVCPSDEESLRFLIYGAVPALEKIAISAVQAVQLGENALAEELAGRALTKDELGRAMGAAILPRLKPTQADAWQSPSWYAAGQSLGESVARFTVYVHALQGLVCHAERVAGHATYRLTSEWLGAPIPDATPVERAALVRRYLSGYGPSTPEHFAAWAGVSPAQAGRLWNTVDSELTAVQMEGRSLSILSADLPRLLAAELPAGVRLLPPYDPYLGQRDRETLVPNAGLHRRVWRTSANPGAVLRDGELTGVWRPAKTGARLVLSIEPWIAFSSTDRARILGEAEGLAKLRGARTVEVGYAT